LTAHLAAGFQRAEVGVSKRQLSCAKVWVRACRARRYLSPVQARSQRHRDSMRWSRRVGMFGVNTERKIRGPVREMRAGRVWGAARCLPRGQGLCSRTVAMSQAPEDRARTKRRRVLTQFVLCRRGRLVSRFGQNDVKSTTWTPSTPRRAVWSRPTRRHRSAHTSSRRWDRTARASEGR
jgi:hypothetical protein